MTSTIEGLIAALEAASGPDGGLDAAIFESLGWKEVYVGDESRGYFVPRYKQWQHADGRTRRALPDAVPMYTASVDAALTLVPEGCGWEVGVALDLTPQARVYGHDVHSDDVGTHPAIALCIAALRAREQVKARAAMTDSTPAGSPDPSRGREAQSK